MRANLKILVIDDEESITNTIKRSLRLADYENVATASTYEEAIVYIRSEQPQIVISDINLPDGDGLTILQETKAVSPLTQVIMITGKGDQPKVLTALEYGAADFIRKPMDMVDFKQIVGEAVSKVVRWADLYEDLIVESYRK